MLRKVLWKILLYSFLVFFFVVHGTEYWFSPLTVNPLWTPNDFLIFIFLGWVFWLIYDIIWRIVKLLATPLNRITLWFFSVLINIVAIYGFAYVITFVLDTWIVVEVWTPLEIILFSVIVRVIDFVF